MLHKEGLHHLFESAFRDDRVFQQSMIFFTNTQLDVVEAYA